MNFSRLWRALGRRMRGLRAELLAPATGADNDPPRLLQSPGMVTRRGFAPFGLTYKVTGALRQTVLGPE
jgi:hypothetical protein